MPSKPRRLLSALLKVLSALIALLVILAAGALLTRYVMSAQIREEGAIEAAAGIETLEAVRIGGIEQWLHIRGRDRSNPVLLFLHGGPGSPAIASGRSMQAGWEQHFTVVQWDQRGGGKTYTSNADQDISPTLTIDQYVSDTVEVIHYLRQRLGQDKIVLLGHSWGTLLGLTVASQHPELVAAYVGSGQLVHGIEYEHLVYDTVLKVAQRRQDTEALALIEGMGRPPWTQARFLINNRTISRLYIDYLDEISNGAMPSGTGSPGEYLSLLLSPEYTLSNLVDIVAGAKLCTEAMYGPASQPGIGSARHANLRELGPYFKVPVFFFLGRHDLATPSSAAAEYFEEIDAPVKKLVWFESSAHTPMTEEQERYSQALIELVLPAVRLKISSPFNRR